MTGTPKDTSLTIDTLTTYCPTSSGRRRKTRMPPSEGLRSFDGPGKQQSHLWMMPASRLLWSRSVEFRAPGIQVKAQRLPGAGDELARDPVGF